MVWQVEVPGEQTVTLTHGLLGYEPDEQREPFTEMGITLSAPLPGTVRAALPVNPP